MRDLTGAIVAGQESSKVPPSERQLVRFTRLLRHVGADASLDADYARLVRCSADLLGVVVARRRQRANALSSAEVWGLARAVAQVLVSHHDAQEAEDGALLDPPSDVSDTMLRLKGSLTRRHGAREWCLGLIPVFGAAGATIPQLRAWIPHLPSAAVSTALQRMVRTGAARRYGDRFVLTAAGRVERDTRVLAVRTDKP